MWVPFEHDGPHSGGELKRDAGAPGLGQIGIGQREELRDAGEPGMHMNCAVLCWDSCQFPTQVSAKVSCARSTAFAVCCSGVARPSAMVVRAGH